MLNNFWTNPLSWIGIYLIGYVITVVIFSLPEGLSKIRNKTPKFLIRVFVFFIFIMPIIVLPFTKGSIRDSKNSNSNACCLNCGDNSLRNKFPYQDISPKTDRGISCFKK